MTPSGQCSRPTRTGMPESGEQNVQKDAGGKAMRRITPGYLKQRLPMNNPIGMNQAYISRIISNPKTPECNRETAIDFVMENPDMFMPRPVDTPDRLLNEMNMRRNGNADPGFIRRISSMRCNR